MLWATLFRLKAVQPVCPVRCCAHHHDAPLLDLSVCLPAERLQEMLAAGRLCDAPLIPEAALQSAVSVLQAGLPPRGFFVLWLPSCLQRQCQVRVVKATCTRRVAPTVSAAWEIEVLL